MKGANKKQAYNVKVNMRGTKEASKVSWKNASVFGTIEGDAPFPKTPSKTSFPTLPRKEFSFFLTPLVGFSRVEDVGQTLKFFGLSSQVQQGFLLAHMKRPREDAPYKGTLQMRDFDCDNIPLLAKLLSLVSPTMVFDMFMGKKTYFSTLFGHFSFSHQEGLFVHNMCGVAAGGLGFLLRGMIRSPEDILIVGSLVPFYAVNSLFSAVPVVGPLFLGGRRHGFSSLRFTLKGALQKPSLTINPFEYVAIGLLKYFFSHQKQEELYLKSLEKTFSTLTP